jgi:hypothetical protein
MSIRFETGKLVGELDLQVEAEGSIPRQFQIAVNGRLEMYGPRDPVRLKNAMPGVSLGICGVSKAITERSDTRRVNACGFGGRRGLGWLNLMSLRD